MCSFLRKPDTQIQKSKGCKFTMPEINLSKKPYMSGFIYCIIMGIIKS